jgi:hypothetical protein
MSRTYRRSQVQLDCNCGAPIITEEVVALLSGETKKLGLRTFYINGICHWYWNSSANRNNMWFRSGYAPERACNCGVKYDFWTKRNFKRDRKPWFKPNKAAKMIRIRSNKAKEKSKMAQKRYDDIPFFKMTDRRDWY